MFILHGYWCDLGGGGAGKKGDVVVLTDANFEEEVLNSKDVVLVEFYAPWYARGLANIVMACPNNVDNWQVWPLQELRAGVGQGCHGPEGCGEDRRPRCYCTSGNGRQVQRPRLPHHQSVRRYGLPSRSLTKRSLRKKPRPATFLPFARNRPIRCCGIGTTGWSSMKYFLRPNVV